MSSKVVAISQATDGKVGVLEGWGGMYMLDLIPSGICGVMPGLAVSDLLAKVFQLATGGDLPGAYEIFPGGAAADCLQFAAHGIVPPRRETPAYGARHSGSTVVRQLTLGLNEHLEDRHSLS